MASIQLVQAVVKDPEWQKFRLSLKGKTTQEKLEALGMYYARSEDRESDYIRIDNYLKALARGGQLFAQPTVELLVKGLLAIRKER